MITGLFKDIPSGVGSKGLIHLSRSDEAEVAVKGAQWAIKRGFGSLEDLQTTEDRGCMQGADPSILSDRAVKRGLDQLGTLGSGNHFLEIQVVDRIYNEETAKAYRLFEGQVTILIHTGSRGFGYQICDDFIKQMTKQATKDIPELPDRQLVYAMLKSDLAKNYIAAMACAANYAWANRQILMGMTEEILMRELSIGPKDLGMNLLYDVCHNIAKMEKHTVNGHETTVCVHRKGATRALPPGHSLLPEIYRDTGQPVLVPGDMGTASYILSGTKGAREHSFCSSCHGAGRILSRNQAIKKAKGRSIDLEMEDIGILVCAKGKRTLKEEMPEAYKDISQVIDVVCGAGLANKVARLRPLAVMKG
jgi:tRNA-splicing ligase RtcB